MITAPATDIEGAIVHPDSSLEALLPFLILDQTNIISMSVSLLSQTAGYSFVYQFFSYGLLRSSE